MEISGTCMYCGRNDRRSDALYFALKGLLEWVKREHAKNGFQWGSHATPDSVVRATLVLGQGEDRPCT